MELDLSSLWSWTIPLWSLFLIVAFLGGVLTTPVVLMGIVPTPATATTATAIKSGGRYR
jgi:hypothetical protein